MDNGNQDIVKEYHGNKFVVVKCNGCNKTIGDFTEFKKTESRKNWSAELNKMDWDIKFNIQNHKIACDCGNQLGHLTSHNNVLFDRKAMNLKY